MATLNDADYAAIQLKIKNDPTARSVFKAWGLSRATWKTLFQTVETWFVGAFTTTPSTSFKAAVETVTGPATNNQAKQVALVWMGWRFDKNP